MQENIGERGRKRRKEASAKVARGGQIQNGFLSLRVSWPPPVRELLLFWRFLRIEVPALETAKRREFSKNIKKIE